MRLTIYIMLVLLALVAVSYWGQPIQGYINRVKTESNMQQRQTAIVASDKRANTLQHSMVDLSAAIPTADQVRIGLIHNAISNDGNEILQYDIVSAVSPPGKTAGSLSTNLPLGNWSDFLRPLLAHQCATINTDKMMNDSEKGRLKSAKIVVFITCPVFNSKGQLLGALFADWDKTDDVPANLDTTETTLKKTATGIATTVGTN